MWGDGNQTRSFCYIDDAIEGGWRLFNSDYKMPLNIGSDEDVSMNDMAKMAMEVRRHQCRTHSEPLSGFTPFSASFH
jgi:nucleoside-diphosphate-sugar epimerase